MEVVRAAERVGVARVAARVEVEKAAVKAEAVRVEAKVEVVRAVARAGAVRVEVRVGAVKAVARVAAATAVEAKVGADRAAVKAEAARVEAAVRVEAAAMAVEVDNGYAVCVGGVGGVGGADDGSGRMSSSSFHNHMRRTRQLRCSIGDVHDAVLTRQGLVSSLESFGLRLDHPQADLLQHTFVARTRWRALCQRAARRSR